MLFTCTVVVTSKRVHVRVKPREPSFVHKGDQPDANDSPEWLGVCTIFRADLCEQRCLQVCLCECVCYLKAGALLTHRSRTTIVAKSGGACGNIGSPLAGMYLW